MPVCTKCGSTTPDNFYEYQLRRKRQRCKSCLLEMQQVRLRAQRDGSWVKPPLQTPEEKTVIGSARSKKYREAHRERYRGYQRAWAKANPTKVRSSRESSTAKPAIQAKMRHYRQTHKRQVFDRRIAWSYGLTRTQFDELLLQSCGRCMSCFQQFKQGRAPFVDHNHDTGEVRGLLCQPCNTALGILHECSVKLRQLADYIEAYATPTFP